MADEIVVKKNGRYEIWFGGSRTWECNEDPVEIVLVYPHKHSVDGYRFIISENVLGKPALAMEDIAPSIGDIRHVVRCSEGGLDSRVREYALQRAAEIANERGRGEKIVDLTRKVKGGGKNDKN